MSKRGRTTVWAVGLILLGAIGVLYAIANSGRKPEEIKAELEAKIEALNKIPPEEAVRRDALAHEYLADPEYKEHAKALWLKLERAHRSLHDAAQLELAAAKEVPRFLAGSKDLSKLAWTDVQNLIGEARTLLGNYATTRFGEPLRKRLEELIATFESMPRPVGPPEVLDLHRKAAAAMKDGRFSDAVDSVDEFNKRLGAQDFARKTEDLLESIRTKASAAAAVALKKSQDLLDRGDKGTALQVVERCLPDFRRFPKEKAELEAQRRKLTPR